MYPVILKATEDNTFFNANGQQPDPRSEDLFPYDEKLESALCTLLTLVQADGSDPVKAAFGDFLNYVEGLEKTIKRQYQATPRVLTWVETGTITVS